MRSIYKSTHQACPSVPVSRWVEQFYSMITGNVIMILPSSHHKVSDIGTRTGSVKGLSNNSTTRIRITPQCNLCFCVLKHSDPRNVTQTSLCPSSSQCSHP